MTDKVRQIWYDLRHQPVVTWVTVVGTALSVFMLMVVITLQQLSVMPYAPESNRPRLLYGQNIHIANTDNPDVNSSGGLSYDLADKLYSNLEGVECSSRMNIDSWNAEAEGTTGIPCTAAVRKVDAEYWNIYDHTLRDGRYFDRTECEADAKVAVISETMGRKLFGDNKIVGSTVKLRFQPYTVVGVIDDTSKLALQGSGEIFVPMSAASAGSWSDDGYFGDVAVALLVAEGTDEADIRKQVESRYAQLATDLAPDGKTPLYHGQPYGVRTVGVADYGSNTTPEDGAQKSEDLITYFILLLLPAINLSCMLHSRLRRRVGEFGIRRAFGCTRLQLIRDILSENLVVTFLGGLAGWLSAVVFMRMYSGLYSYGPFDIISGDTPAFSLLFNWRLILAVFAVCFILNILSASVPAWQASRLSTVDAVNARHN